MSNSLSVISGTGAPRRRYPVEYKRQVVQESLAPGTSIAGVALAHGINANMLHNWRWQYRRGDFEPIMQGSALLPVQLTTHPVTPALRPHKPARIIDGQGSVQPGDIELIFSAARVVLHGASDPATLRCVIDALRR